MNNVQLDSYSMLICSKYLISIQDFINVICVNSKFKETTEKLRFNPIPITSLKLFPKIQTQYLYNEKDITIKGIDNYEIWFEVDSDQYLYFKEINIKCHYILYTYINFKKYGDKLPNNITKLDEDCFSFSGSLTTIVLPTSLKELSDGCFTNCSSLKSINLPYLLTSIGYGCFSCCNSLQSISIPFFIRELGYGCFSNCGSLTLINIPPLLEELGDSCFSECSSLKSIILPTVLTSIGKECFRKCKSLTSINIPTSLKLLGEACFYECVQLQNLSIIPKKCFSQPAWML
ncbi:hypothetical protein QTN25_008995 [Entamoeba marina]